MKQWVVSRKMDNQRSEILATFDNEATACAYKHPFYRTHITTWEVDAPRTFRELAVTDLSYRVAEVTDYDVSPMEKFEEPIPSKVRHYVIKGDGVMSSMVGQKNIRQEMAARLSKKFGQPVNIIGPEGPANGDSSVLTRVDASNLLTPESRQLLSKQYYSMIAEYHEERPVQPGVLAAAERWFKKKTLNLLWRTQGHQSYVMNLVNARYGLPTAWLFKIYQSWYHEIWMRKASPMLSLSVSCTEENLAIAGQQMSAVIEGSFGDLILGSLGGLQKIPLADVVGDGKKRYALWIGLLVKGQLAGLLSELVYAKPFPGQADLLKRYLLIKDGKVGDPVIGETVPMIEVEEV